MTQNIQHLLSIFVGLTVLFTSCNNNLPLNEIEENQLNTTTLDYRLDSLNQVYGINSLNIRHKPLDNATEKEDTEELKESKSKADISDADFDGFCSGAGVGGLAGGAVGTIVTGGGSVIGTAIGTLIGMVTGGIIGAVAKSVIAVQKQEEQQMEQGEDEGVWRSLIPQNKDIYAIDLRDPISFYEDRDCLFNEQIIGSNMGFVHNYIISVLYRNNGYRLFQWSPDVLVDSIIYTYANILDSKDLYLEDILIISDEIINNVLIDDITHKDDEYISYFIESYQALISENVCFEKRRDYTEEYMDIIQQEIGDEEYVFLINGAISTYFYSYDLWQTYIPTQKSYRYICINENSDPYLFSSSEAYEHIITTIVYNGAISFAGVPVIRDNKIESIFVFDDLVPLNDVVWNDERNYIQDNTFYIEEDIIFQYVDYYYQEFTIPAGTYQFDRFKGGYVVFFD